MKDEIHCTIYYQKRRDDLRTLARDEQGMIMDAYELTPKVPVFVG